MTTKSIFEFRDYKAYLRHVEAQRPRAGRGFRAEIARAANCQTAYISQVLNGKAHLSLEQAYALNPLLIHSREEGRFFVVLIEFLRAGTKELKAHFLELMEEQIQSQLVLKNRFKVKDVMKVEDQTIYYSEWTYAAVHIALTIPSLQTVEALSEFLQIPVTRVRKVIQFLVSVQLVNAATGGRFEVGNARLHLGNDSALVTKHHTNWRLQSLHSLEREGERDLHYTSIVSLSKEDMLEIKARFVKEMEAFNTIVRDSKEETLACLSLDLFNLDRR